MTADLIFSQTKGDRPIDPSTSPFIYLSITHQSTHAFAQSLTQATVFFSKENRERERERDSGAHFQVLDYANCKIKP